MGDLELIYDTWMQEASDENNALFYETPWLKRIKSGKAIFVIGRKGTGKTAIVEHISHLRGNNMSTKLSFEDYPIENLKGYCDSDAPMGFQYTLLWELLIYSSFCKLLLKDGNLDKKIKGQLNDICPASAGPIYALIQNIVKKGFSATLPTGFGSIGGSKTEEKNLSPKDPRLVRDYLKEIFYQEADRKINYFVLFDSLDMGFNNISTDLNDNNNVLYFSMLACLFRVAKNIKSESKKHGINATPVIFILKEIYSQIRDNDKNKWRDSSVELEWRKDQLQAMLAHRISKTIDGVDPTSFKDSWLKIFTPDTIEIGKNYRGGVNKQSVWEFIAQRTCMRPRDYIVYIKECCKVEFEKGNDIISTSTVTNTAKKYSEIFIDELQDELGQSIPGLKKILSIFSELGRSTFHCEDFKSIYEDRVENGKINDSDSFYEVDELIDVLFDNSIIGNSARGDKKNKFRYKSDLNYLNKDELICLHSGVEEKILEKRLEANTRGKINIELIPHLVQDIQIYLESNVQNKDVHEKFSLLSKTLALHTDASIENKQYIYIRKALNGLDMIVKNHVKNQIEKKRLMEAIRCAHGYELQY